MCVEGESLVCLTPTEQHMAQLLTEAWKLSPTLLSLAPLPERRENPRRASCRCPFSGPPQCAVQGSGAPPLQAWPSASSCRSHEPLSEPVGGHTTPGGPAASGPGLPHAATTGKGRRPKRQGSAPNPCMVGPFTKCWVLFTSLLPTRPGTAAVITRPAALWAEL